MIFCNYSYEKEYSVLHSATNQMEERDGDIQQMEELNLPTTLIVPTASGSMRGVVTFGFDICNINLHVFRFYFQLPLL